MENYILDIDTRLNNDYTAESGLIVCDDGSLAYEFKLGFDKNDYDKYCDKDQVLFMVGDDECDENKEEWVLRIITKNVHKLKFIAQTILSMVEEMERRNKEAQNNDSL